MMYVQAEPDTACRLHWLMPWAASSKEVEDGHHTGDKKADPDVEDGLDGHEPTKKEPRKRSQPRVRALVIPGWSWLLRSQVAAMLGADAGLWSECAWS